MKLRGNAVRASATRRRTATLDDEVAAVLAIAGYKEGVDYEREFKFHMKRRWRFDFAFPAIKLAIEADGVGRSDGGASNHRTLQGYARQAEKRNAAAALGWRVVTITPAWLAKRYDTPTAPADIIKSLLAGEYEAQ